MNLKESTILEKTKDDYNRIASEFSDSRERPWLEMEEFNQYVKNGDRILDLGCGNGRLLSVFQNKEIEYVGVDISERLIERAQNKLQNPKSQIPNKLQTQNSKIQNLTPNTHIPEPKFIIGDMTQPLPFGNHTFDVVFLIASFHHIPGKELRKQVLKEISRIIKPNGLLIMTNWNLRQPKLILKYHLWRLLFNLKYPKLESGDVFIPWKLRTSEVINRYYHAFRKSELEYLLSVGGFKTINQYYTKRSKKTSRWKGDNLVNIVKKA